MRGVYLIAIGIMLAFSTIMMYITFGGHVQGIGALPAGSVADHSGEYSTYDGITLYCSPQTVLCGGDIIIVIAQLVKNGSPVSLPCVLINFSCDNTSVLIAYGQA